MNSKKIGTTIAVLIAAVGITATASADNFLVVNDTSSTSCDTIEAALTALTHTFTRLTTAETTALTPNDVMTTYNAVFWMGSPSSGTEHDWCMALMDAGGNLLVADNDFGYFYGGGTYPIYTTYFESTYVSDAGSSGTLTGQGIMTGINPDISSDPYPDDFTISGANGTVIFDAPSTNVAGTAIERTPVTETYRGIYLSWDFVNTSAADVNSITAAIVAYLSEPVIPVELMSFSIE
ncbi:MAG: hypothetical protein PVG53_14985 [Holophagae bacterium]|jgi:hypothetical protein